MVVVGLPMGGKGMVEGQVHHHVVGDDRGWDPSSDLLYWSSARIFRVGDNICEHLYSYIFIYSCMLDYIYTRYLCHSHICNLK